MIKKNFDLIVFPICIILLTAAMRFFGISDVPFLELASALVAVVARPLLKREHVAGIILSIVGNITFALYFISLGLTGLVILNAVFLTLNSAALYFWMVPDKKTKKIIRPTFLNTKLLGGAIFIMILAAGFGFAINGVVGALDYFALGGGAFGLLLLTRKKVDAWALLMATNVSNVVLFWMTGSFVMLATMFIFAQNDVRAFIRWRIEARLNK